MATPRKSPQDHLPKKSAGFTFDADGNTFTLPPPSEALAKIPGRALRDALMGGSEGEMRLAFHCLESVGADPAAVDALYDKPAGEMTELLLDWFRSAQIEGATVPQS